MELTFSLSDRVQDGMSCVSSQEVPIQEDAFRKGIPAGMIASEAKGKEAPLAKAEVEQLEKQNPQQPAIARAGPARSKWLAYNRRVDVAVEPAALKSARFYPHEANDARLLFDTKRVGESKIHEASNPEAIVASAQ